jgi:hypothetical protein
MRMKGKRKCVHRAHQILLERGRCNSRKASKCMILWPDFEQFNLAGAKSLAFLAGLGAKSCHSVFFSSQTQNSMKARVQTCKPRSNTHA